MAEKTLHVFNTGGTISYGPAGPAGAALTGTPDQMLAALGVPARTVYREILRKGSVNLTPADWQAMAVAAHEAICAGADGVVVLHGTDTMAFTAAALSFMLANLPVPVVLTGSIRPGGAPGGDAPRNLRDALRVAAHGDLAEVCIVFAGDATGTHGAILRGNRARKANAVALDAFASPNFPPLGRVEGDTISYGEGEGERAPRGPRGQPALSPELNPTVRFIHYHPGCTAGFLGRALVGADGAVIAGTGLGHLPTEGGILETIREWGKPVVLVSACWRGGVRLDLYDLDRQILAVENLIPGHDLTPEAALVKLMWVLGRDRALARVRARMQEPVAGELTPA